MSFRAADGTVKTSDDDHAAKTGTITFNPDQMTKTITFEVKGDSREEANETIYLDLYSRTLLTSFSNMGALTPSSQSVPRGQ